MNEDEEENKLKNSNDTLEKGKSIFNFNFIIKEKELTIEKSSQVF